MLYGRAPPSLLFYVASTTKIPEMGQLLLDCESMLTEIKFHLHQAQEQMKLNYDRKRRELNFSEGDFVYLKLRPYKQHSLLSRTVHKLSPRFDCPLKVLRKVGEIAYELQLPKGAKRHNVLYISLLKPALDRTQTSDQALLNVIVERRTFVPKPEEILK